MRWAQRSVMRTTQQVLVLKELDNFIDTQKRVVDKDIKIAKIINENLKIGIM